MSTPHQNVVICNLVVQDTSMIEPGMIVCSKKTNGVLTFHTEKLTEEETHQVVGVSLNYRAKLDQDKVKLKPISVAVRGIIDVITTNCQNKNCGDIIQHNNKPFGTIISEIYSVSGVGSTKLPNKHRVKLEPQLTLLSSTKETASAESGTVASASGFGSEVIYDSSAGATTVEANFEQNISFKDAAKIMKKKKKRGKSKEV